MTAAVVVGGWTLLRTLRAQSSVTVDRHDRENWRMPPLNILSKPVMSAGRRATLAVMASYMAVAMILVIVRIVQLALGH
jgi:hypothetical protein